MSGVESVGADEVAILRAMTPAQKWEVAVQLRQTAWDVAKAGIAIREPALTPEQLDARVRELFLRASD